MTRGVETKRCASISRNASLHSRSGCGTAQPELGLCCENEDPTQGLRLRERDVRFTMPSLEERWTPDHQSSHPSNID